MSKFIQLHILTSYPPANVNRDDMGRPKTAKMGGVDRLRISSQCLKRAWRTSEIFKETLSEYMGKRTKRFGRDVYDKMIETNPGIEPKNAKEWTRKIMEVFAKPCTPAYLLPEKCSNKVNEITQEIKSNENLILSAEKINEILDLFKDDNLACYKKIVNAVFKDELKTKNNNTIKLDNITSLNKLNSLINKLKEKHTEEAEKEDGGDDLEVSQLVFIAPEEQTAMYELAIKLAKEARAPTSEELKLLRHPQKAADIALFGRMLADQPSYNMEAACQVSHAISVHPVIIEDDYFTAIDDLNDPDEKTGASHIGERGFASALFYLYICIDKGLLIDQNLKDDSGLITKVINALVRAAILVSPSGMQNSHGSRAWASYVFAEKGDYQPRSLSVAFLKPIRGENYLDDSITALKKNCATMDIAYEIATLNEDDKKTLFNNGGFIATKDNVDKILFDMSQIKRYEFNAINAIGTISELANFCTGVETCRNT